MGDEEVTDELEDQITDLEPLAFQGAGVEPLKPRLRPKLSTGQAVEKYGRKSSDHIVRQEKTKAALANRELIRRLMQDPGQFKAGELNFIAGTAVDKVAKKERWERAGGDGGQGWVNQFVEMFSKLQEGGGIDLRLTVERPRRDVSVTTVDAEALTDSGVGINPALGDGTFPER